MDRDLHRLALGTVQFGLNYGIANKTGQIDIREVREILKEAKREGITTLDTAIAYGTSEASLGSVGIESWQVITKLPPKPQHCTDLAAWVRDEVDASLRRMHTNKIKGLLLHKADDLLTEYGDELFDAMSSLKKEGNIESIGISIYNPDEIEHYLQRFEIDLIQTPMNIFDRRLLTTGKLTRLQERRIEVHVRSAFLQGLLLMKEQDIPPYFHQWQEHIKKFHTWLRDNHLSPLVACLQFLKQLTPTPIAKIIVGVDSLFQLRQIIDAFRQDIILDFPQVLEIDDPGLINPTLWSKV